MITYGLTHRIRHTHAHATEVIHVWLHAYARRPSRAHQCTLPPRRGADSFVAMSPCCQPALDRSRSEEMRGFDDWALSPSNRTQGAALQHRHARTCRPRVIVDSAVEHPVTRLIHDEASQQRQRCSSGVHRCFTRVASKTAGCSRRKHRAASRRRVKHVEFRVGGCRAPGPHAISTRTAHTTTTSSIHRVPKTVGRIPGSTLPPVRDCHRPDGVSTSLPVYQSIEPTRLPHCR